MDLKKAYENLYQHWLKEVQQVELTKLNQKLFKKYSNLLNFINNHQENEGDTIRFHVFESYKKNLHYLYGDLLKMRKFKIINTALTLKEIEIDNVIEAEKLLYQNLVSSIKGYKKVKAITIFEVEEKVNAAEIIGSKSEKEPKIVQSALSIIENKSKISEIVNEKKEEIVDFTLLRFIKNTPPLVGIDLINYGPFEEDDIAYLPSPNANILVIEKFAEKIEIPE